MNFPRNISGRPRTPRQTALQSPRPAQEAVGLQQSGRFAETNPELPTTRNQSPVSSPQPSSPRSPVGHGGATTSALPPVPTDLISEEENALRQLEILAKKTKLGTTDLDEIHTYLQVIE